MGYSARYHVASLAAVFLALAVGILIGAGLGSDVLTGARKDLEQSLKGDLEDANSEIAGLEGELASQQRFAETVYPALATDTLPGRAIAVVAFGGRPEDVRDNILDALGPTGAEVTQLAVVREPPDLRRLGDLVPGERPLKAERERQKIAEATRRAGAALVNGAEYYDRAREALLSSFSGRAGPVGGVVVVREHPDLQGPEAAATEVLETNFIDGLVSGGVPVVGVERTDTDPSSIEFFDSQGLTTVDDMDLVAGRVALVYALRGAQGNFGVDEGSDELIPGLLRRAGPTTGP